MTEVVRPRPDILHMAGVNYGLVLSPSNVADNWESVIDQLLAQEAAPDFETFRETAAQITRQREVLGGAQQSKFPSIRIDNTTGKITLYHDTTNISELFSNLAENNIRQAPHNSNWGSRCYGLGLACFTDPETKLLGGRQRVAITLPFGNVGVVLKQAYWRALSQKILEKVSNDPNAKNTFESAINNALQGGDLLQAKEEDMAFQYSAAVIDCACGLRPGLNRLSFRTAIQGNYVAPGEEEPIRNFGYRTHTDRRVYSPNYLEGAMVYAFASLDKPLSEQEAIELKALINVLHNDSIYGLDPISGWDGTTHTHISDQMKRFFAMKIADPNHPLRKYISGTELAKLLDGTYPINHTPKSPSLIFGTDLGSNNVAVLTDFNPGESQVEVIG